MTSGPATWKKAKVTFPKKAPTPTTTTATTPTDLRYRAHPTSKGRLDQLSPALEGLPQQPQKKQRVSPVGSLMVITCFHMFSWIFFVLKIRVVLTGTEFGAMLCQKRGFALLTLREQWTLAPRMWHDATRSGPISQDPGKPGTDSNKPPISNQTCAWKLQWTTWLDLWKYIVCPCQPLKSESNLDLQYCIELWFSNFCLEGKTERITPHVCQKALSSKS